MSALDVKLPKPSLARNCFLAYARFLLLVVLINQPYDPPFEKQETVAAFANLVKKRRVSIQSHTKDRANATVQLPVLAATALSLLPETQLKKRIPYSGKYKETITYVRV